MRILQLGYALVALHVLGCGSPSSSSNLYANGGQCHGGTCPPPGTGGIAGGSGGIGAGGVIPFGGSGGAAGFENTGGFFSSTGGIPFLTGGFGGLLDGSIATGGEGGAANTCPAAGHYSGSYSGTYVLFAQVSGTIEFTIDPSGSVTGTYTGTNPNNGSSADLTGTFDCTTLELAMRIENGEYPGTFGLPVQFSGTMPGTYSADARSFNGTWKISDSSSQSGSGTWSAQ